MKLFLDTSSLLKLYHTEEGSDQLLGKVFEADVIYLLTLAQLGFRSALWKKVRTQEVTKEQCLAVIGLFEKGLQSVCLDCA
jgi:uncharacterized protein